MGEKVYRLIQGDAMSVLRTLPSKSVQVIVTSPPYLGHRSYSTNPQVWGGQEACDHDWHGFTRKGISGGTGEASRKHITGRVDGNFQIVPDTEQAVCSLCGAWRGEWGSEPTPEMYAENTVAVFREARRVLADTGTLWLNLGDSYYNNPGGQNGSTGGVSAKAQEASRQAGRQERIQPHPTLKPKDLVGVPWMVAFALRADGWYLRSEIIWHKPNPMPESTTDRPGKAHEQVFLLTKSATYDYDADAVKEPAAWERWGAQTTAKRNPGTLSWVQDKPKEELTARTTRNKRTVWSIPTKSSNFDFCAGCNTLFQGRKRGTIIKAFTEEYDPKTKKCLEVKLCPVCDRIDGWIGHFAAFPPALVEPCVLAGTSEAGQCRDCGKAWERVVERKPMVIARSGRRDAMGEQGRTQTSGTMLEPASSKTVGWRPSCDCGAPAAPQTVLDLCSGTATTGLVALSHGRRYLGIELNPEYLALSRARLEQRLHEMEGVE